MSDHERHGPTITERIRRWLWLDGPQRTDASEAQRGFYPGLTRKPVGWRFLLVMIVIGITIGLLILATRDDETQPNQAGQPAGLGALACATETADWVSAGLEGEMSFSSYEFKTGDARMRFVCTAEPRPDHHWLSLAETITPADNETAL